MEYICCICGKKFTGWGNNPYPVDKDPDHKCCDGCNANVVIRRRMEIINESKN